MTNTSDLSRPPEPAKLNFSQSLLVVIFALVAAVILTWGLGLNKPNPLFVLRDPLIQKVGTAMMNGASVEDINQLIQTEPRIAVVLLLSHKRSELYAEPVSLDQVLRDYKAQLFLKPPVDAKIVERAQAMIDENERINPFDRLGADQKIYFENVRSKLVAQYSVVQQDISAIANELAAKNALVERYLSDASLGLRLSIVAIVLSIAALVGPIIGGWRWFRSWLVRQP